MNCDRGIENLNMTHIKPGLSAFVRQVFRQKMLALRSDP
jgi:hypothetical protein